jgi:hypothetical protein
MRVQTETPPRTRWKVYLAHELCPLDLCPINMYADPLFATTYNEF